MTDTTTVLIRKGLSNVVLYDLISFETRNLVNNFFYYAAILTAIGFCFYLAYKRLIKTGYSGKQAAKFSIITGITAFPLGILSSRGANMFYSPPELWSLSEFFIQTFSGGIHTFHTCWVLPTIMIIITAKILKIRIFEIFDIEFLYMPVGHAIGRVGCLLVGCCWGDKTTCHVGKTIYSFYIPIPLLAIVNNILLFFCLRFLFRKIYYFKTDSAQTLQNREQNDISRHIFSGTVIGAYFCGYGINRFLIEYIRTEKIITLGFTQAQLAMIIYIITGLTFFSIVGLKYFSNKKNHK